jgi:hypothetical protein
MFLAPPQEVRQQPVAVPSAPAPEPAVDANVDSTPEMPLSPAHAQLGSEGLARLRARYADVMAGISRRVSDPERQEQLKTSAERMNPDNWVTTDEVRAGLEDYESVFESLRGLIGRRRHRRPRASGEVEGGRPVQPESADGDGISAGAVESPDAEEFDDDDGGSPPAAQD